MTADEMFKRLGYRKTYDTQYEVEVEKIENSEKKLISVNTEIVEIMSGENHSYKQISIDELKAIIVQLKELGVELE